jgi:hypothetical protein
MGVDISGRKPKTEEGDYFHANWWGWRPINAICQMAAYESKLKIDFSYWGSNDGKGLRTQKQCDKLADAMELFISDGLNEHLTDDDSRIYIVMGGWCEAGTGKFIGAEKEHILNQQFEYGSLQYSTIVTEDGMRVESAHSTSLGRIKEFISFLRNCGGFQIW